jgi:hypothetical protein
MLRPLVRHRLVLAALVTSALIGAVCVKLNTSGNLVVGGAVTHVLVDDPDVSILDRSAVTQDVSTLQKRAELYGRLMTTPPVLELIAKRAGVPADQISGLARVTAVLPHTFLQPRSEQRANQIADSLAPYRLELQASAGEPILAIYTQAPSVGAAQRLANASILGLRDYLRQLATRQGFPVAELPQLRQLGGARGGVANSGARIEIGSLTFITAFALSFVGLLVLVRRPWRRARRKEVLSSAPGAKLSPRALADWPRTTRLLPWSVAVLIAMIWLTPFDKIQLAMSAPVNITLDRILLPLVAAIWLIARTAGPGIRPRVHITRVHVAIGVFLACAFLSVVLNARYLNQTGDLALSFKKLPLLLSYVSIFVIVASSVRRTEVPAFMNYTFVLAVICALEIIYEYHFKQNLFNTWFAKLPHPFQLVADTSGSSLDSLGRRWVEGPTGYGVDAITMLSMVLPVGLLGIVGSKARSRRILYSLGSAVLIAAMFATQRKSALVAPGAVILMLAYFRRRELLKLAPLVLVLVVMIPVVSPGAIHGVLAQVSGPGSTHVATVSDRTADYDAVRPDVWANIAIGRGYGSYNHTTYRILDSEILSPLVETGLLGLAAYLMIGGSVVLVARKTASQRDPTWSPLAICGVSAGVCILVSSTLYDLLAYPHGTFTFLYISGLVVAVVSRRDDPDLPRVGLRERALSARARGQHPNRAPSRRAVPSG